MKFQAIKKTRIYEEVVKQLKDLIANGELKPGDKLPSERELAAEFDVSRVSVRQALTVLETLGLIERKVGGGTFSVTEKIDFDIDPAIALIMSKKEKLSQPLEVRRMLEPNLAKLAAERAVEEDIINLKSSLKKQEEKIKNDELIIEEDNEFHYYIAKASKNEIALKISELIYDMLYQTREESIKARGGSRRSYEGHIKIIEAIENKDPDAAYEAMMGHLEEVEALIMTHIAEKGKD